MTEPGPLTAGKTVDKDATLALSRIPSKARVTISQDVRKEFDLRLGDRILFVKRGSELVVRKSK